MTVEHTDDQMGSKGTGPAAFLGLVAQLLFVKLRDAGLLRPAGQIGLLAKYGRWFAECERVFRDRGYLDDGRSAPDSQQTWRDWEALLAASAEDPRWRAKARLVDVCVRQLPEILRGEVAATRLPSGRR